mgnify:CR=1 FL=1
MTAGRVCPLHYRYSPRTMAAAPALETSSLYVVGGLYGNPEALDALEAITAREPEARVVVNGDCHFFDHEVASFGAIQDRVLAHRLTAGNVEAELAEPSDAGCGCAYPDYVSDAAVARSNAIMAALKAACPWSRARELEGLDRTLTVAVGDQRVGVVHGDPSALAGWGLAAEALPPADGELHRALGCGDGALTARETLSDWFREAEVSIFASSHTCLPVLTDYALGGARRAVINNGSAGMPNFCGTAYGLASRIATTPHSSAVARLSVGDLYLELMPLCVDTDAWWQRFRDWWPPGSAAYQSYAQRLAGDVAYRPEQAVRGSACWLGHPQQFQ